VTRASTWRSFVARGKREHSGLMFERAFLAQAEARQMVQLIIAWK
jgi:hypothetical protein